MRYTVKLYAAVLLIGVTVFLSACEEKSEPIPMASDPAWSPDGQKIVYACYQEILTVDLDGSGSRTSDIDLCVMNQDGTNRRYLVREQGDDRQPRWAPDGKAIAFASSGKLYVVDLEGGQPRQISKGLTEGPYWSPDGYRIAFVGRRDSGPYAINVIDRDGRLLASLEDPHGELFCHLQWSPDGKQIAYTSTSGSNCHALSGDDLHNIMIADAQNGFRVRKIAENLARVQDLAWVDQEALTYSNRPGVEGGLALYTINLRSGSRTKINTEKEVFLYAWAPDERALAYTTSAHEVYVQDRSSGRATLVWGKSVWSIFHLEWSPDSQRLLISVSEQVSEEHTMGLPAYARTIWVISRDGTFAKRVTPLVPGEPGP